MHEKVSKNNFRRILGIGMKLCSEEPVNILLLYKLKTDTRRYFY